MHGHSTGMEMVANTFPLFLLILFSFEDLILNLN